MLAACVEGELHDFPSRLVADALDLAGFEVRYLGASVPHDSLVAMLDDDPPHLLSWHPGLAAEVRANVAGSDATELVQRARQLLGVEA